MEEIEKAKSYTPTEAMRNNAKRGLEARQKAPKSQKGGFDAKEAKAAGVGSGVARARDIINGDLSLESVKRMYSFLSRAKAYYKPNERTASGNLTPGTQAFLLWSGPAGLSWARNILRQEGIIKSVDPMTDEELEAEFGVQITKAANQELKQCTFIAMLPDSVDLHGDYTSADEVRKAMESFNRSEKRANLFHVSMTDKFEVLESYLAPVDFILNDEFVSKGTWLMTLQVKDDSLWELVKSGDINGISIGAMANCEIIEKEDE